MGIAAEVYLDEKWKLSKKESSSSSSSSSSRRVSSPSSSCATFSLIKNSSSSSSSSSRRCSFTRKCAALVKEQRARFYIMRRCVTMLLCWRDYTDS